MFSNQGEITLSKHKERTPFVKVTRNVQKSGVRLVDVVLYEQAALMGFPCIFRSVHLDGHLLTFENGVISQIIGIDTLKHLQIWFSKCSDYTLTVKL